MIKISIFMYIFIILGVSISAFFSGYEFRRIRHENRRCNAKTK